MCFRNNITSLVLKVINGILLYVSDVVSLHNTSLIQIVFSTRDISKQLSSKHTSTIHVTVFILPNQTQRTRHKTHPRHIVTKLIHVIALIVKELASVTSVAESWQI